MASYLQTQVTDRRKQLADLDRRRIVLEAELRAYEDALSHELKAQASTPTPVESAPVANTQVPLDLNSPDDVKRISAFNRLSDDWRKVLITLRDRETFRSRDVLNTAQEVGMTTTMPNVRSQLTLLTQRGILRRVSEGDYSVEPVSELLRMIS